ncbi:heparinase II/III domain-containing protein [Dyadobacter sandarakinus]|uniref:Heparinase II/III family protein n=1 Tax=Dyadobacter sandarakinus TaxID=2747268 RepID=A0ABX7I3J2_9BACT|nr:heparinase II/III family protein [Dyadobacter sandarakinus]QRR00632.1 heparinase II/III family protein [Dyadobacter sandarakinus]
MKKRFFSYLYLILLAGFMPALAQKKPGPKSNNPQITLDRMPQSHPRLLMSASDEQRIRSELSKHDEWQGLHRVIIAESEKIILLPPVAREKIGRRLLDKSRECLRRVFQLAYAYRFTRDERFLRRAEQEMLAVSQFEDWNPTHFLDVAEMTLGLAIGYDWLYDGLPESSRQLIRAAILEKGIRPSFDKQYNGFVTAKNNWNQVCNTGITFGALAIAEDEPELAGKVVQRAVSGLSKIMAISYSPDGVYPEGYSYWDYGTSFNALFIDAIEKALGTDYGLCATPGFLKTAGFVEHIAGPTGLVHNWGDSGNRDHINPATFWFAYREKDPTLVYNQLKFLERDKVKTAGGNRLLPLAIIWGAQLDLDRVTPPKQLVWTGQGDSPVAYMRTSWTDPNAIFVGFKAGSPATSHGHMDIGSFVLDQDGERWAMDFGMQDYNSLESKGVSVFGKGQTAQRWSIFRYTNMVHNTLTVNGQLQQVDGSARMGRVSDDPDFMSAIADITPVYAGQLAKAERGIAIVNGRYTVVRDELEGSGQAATIRWTLLTKARVNIVDATTVELSQDGKRMQLVFDSSIPIQIRTWSTAPPSHYDAPNPGTTLVGFEAELPAGSKASVNAFFVKAKNEVGKVAPLDTWK